MGSGWKTSTIDTSQILAWLVWHLTRVQDDRIAGVAGTEQIWTADEWYEAFGLPFPEHDTGYGHSRNEVGKVAGLTVELLTGYHAAVHENTVHFLDSLAVKDLTQIVDPSWTPPVTLGVRLISILTDDLQHAGQAAYRPTGLSGLYPRRHCHVSGRQVHPHHGREGRGDDEGGDDTCDPVGDGECTPGYPSSSCSPRS
ncbi:DUF664 domain-containing protein [Streptomyces sp. NPDC057555]|uniref:mycothiol transferase n=1 Tax=Streptomyces sp. NPDC057555 TaxID=3346166 RepID=UPI00367B79FC